MSDRLTGLPTHRDLKKTPPSTNSTSELWVDIDGLIWINDQSGFEAGDQAVRAVAAALLAELNPLGDNLYRVAGDEFLALLGDMDETAAFRVGTKIVAAVAQREIPYRRRDRSSPTHLQVNVAAFRIDNAHLLQSIGEYRLGDPLHGALADAVYKSKLSNDTSAGVVVRVAFEQDP